MKTVMLGLLTLVPLTVSAAAKPTHDGTPTVQQFEKSVGSYPYRAPAERVQRIQTGLRKITPCMTKAEVRALLGEPDYGQELWPKQAHGDWLGTAWTYWIAKRGSGVNMLDPAVEAFFDTNGRAHWIVPRGIDRAKEMGDVKHVCAP